LTVVPAYIADTQAIPTASHYAIKLDSVCFDLMLADGVTKANILPIEVTAARGTLVTPGLASYPSSMAPALSDKQPIARNAFRGAWDVHVWQDVFVAGYRQRTAALVAFPATAPAIQAPAINVPKVELAPSNISAETGRDTAKLTAEIQGGSKGKK
jgi:hypothetical protein